MTFHASDENQLIRIAKCDAFSSSCESIS